MFKLAFVHTSEQHKMIFAVCVCTRWLLYGQFRLLVHHRSVHNSHGLLCRHTGAGVQKCHVKLPSPRACDCIPSDKRNIIRLLTEAFKKTIRDSQI